MTNIQLIQAIKKALQPNENGEIPSIMNAMDLIEKFRESVIKEYLKDKKSKENDCKCNDTTAQR